MKEADLSKKIVNALRKRGAWCQKIHGSAFQTVGLPDIIGCYMGMFFGLETKLPGKENTLTRIQAVTLSEIRKSGGIGMMVTTVDQAVDICDIIEVALGGALDD